ncbi:MAG: non-hydrolyzing UDP-N-acetylglucosamine 2-epimerase, partial [Methanobacterium sp.]
GSEKKKIVDAVREILNNAQLYSKMSKARNPYGVGNSSVKILDAILKLYNENELEMRVPEDIMKIRSRKIVEIKEDITVIEFEKKNSFMEIRMVFENGKLLFPYDHLNLKNKLVLLEELT